MPERTKAMDKVFFFVMMPISILGNLIMSGAMPTATTRGAWFIWAVCMAIAYIFAMINGLTRKFDLEEPLFIVAKPCMIVAVIALGICGLCYISGA